MSSIARSTNTVLLYMLLNPSHSSVFLFTRHGGVTVNTTHYEMLYGISETSRETTKFLLTRQLLHVVSAVATWIVLLHKTVMISHLHYSKPLKVFCEIFTNILSTEGHMELDLHLYYFHELNVSNTHSKAMHTNVCRGNIAISSFIKNAFYIAFFW